MMRGEPSANSISSPVNQPAASVLLPVYNGARYLEAAITSIIEQSFPNFELLLLDDGSTDDSLALMRAFARRDERCIVHTRENRGLVRTLNEGIDRSRADIIIRMDADDVSHARRFQLQVAYLDAHPDCVVVGTEAMLIDPEGRHLRRFGIPCNHIDIDSEQMRGLGGMIVHPAAAIRKAALITVGGYREAFQDAEDFDLFLRLAEVGQLANLPEVLLDYRQHLGSIGHRRNVAQVAAKERALAEARSRRGVIAPSTAPKTDITEPPTTAYEVHRKWAWWALSAGNVATARAHALKAVRLAPFAAGNLRLVACVLRGH